MRNALFISLLFLQSSTALAVDIFVDNLARHLPAKYRATSFEVVFGVFVTCVGIGAILGIQAMFVCLLCFAASGLRMIWGDVRRTEVLG